MDQINSSETFQMLFFIFPLDKMASHSEIKCIKHVTLHSKLTSGFLIRVMRHSQSFIKKAIAYSQGFSWLEKCCRRYFLSRDSFRGTNISYINFVKKLAVFRWTVVNVTKYLRIDPTVTRAVYFQVQWHNMYVSNPQVAQNRRKVNPLLHIFIKQQWK